MTTVTTSITPLHYYSQRQPKTYAMAGAAGAAFRYPLLIPLSTEFKVGPDELRIMPAVHGLFEARPIKPLAANNQQ